jgi:predicted nucleotidyltransferase
MNTFKGTDLEISVLTKWIIEKYSKYKITEIRYFGSRMNGEPRENSDFDVYILFDKKSPSGKPIFTEIFKHKEFRYQIEFHAFMDFHDRYIPKYLIGEAINVLENEVQGF